MTTAVDTDSRMGRNIIIGRLVYAIKDFSLSVITSFVQCSLTVVGLGRA